MSLIVGLLTGKGRDLMGNVCRACGKRVFKRERGGTSIITTYLKWGGGGGGGRGCLGGGRGRRNLGRDLPRIFDR